MSCAGAAHILEVRALTSLAGKTPATGNRIAKVIATHGGSPGCHPRLGLVISRLLDRVRNASVS